MTKLQTPATQTMARIWKERLDPEHHIDFMRTSWVGGVSPEKPRDSLVPQWVYFVDVCAFTFQFHSLDQIEECLAYFLQRVRPSTREPGYELEHYWQRWYERLPKGLTRESKRRRIVKALRQALATFQSS